VTLAAPAAGMLAGAAMAWGAPPGGTSDFAATGAATGVDVVTGAVAAAVLNAGSNALNQIYDLDIDRVNKADRPLPSGAVSVRQAGVFAALAYAGGLALAATLNAQCLALFVLAALSTLLYSVPPVRTKRHWLGAQLTIASSRGFLLPVAGWSTVKSVATAEPWLVGGVFGAFILGASATKDFADIPGDRAGGCTTLPIRFGARRSVRIIAPFLVLPFVALGAMAGLDVLNARRTVLLILSAGLALWGAYVARLLTRDADELATVAGNHVSWGHMYALMVTAQAGVALAYLL